MHKECLFNLVLELLAIDGSLYTDCWYGLQMLEKVANSLGTDKEKAVRQVFLAPI